jgi:pimeloyl-ACP methyl ester carboxylesterase
LERAGDVVFVRESFRPWFKEWPRPELDQWAKNFARTPAWAHRAVCELALWTDISTEVAGITAPALVIAGEHDPVYGPVYQRNAVLPTLPDPQFVTVDCGHGLFLERPKEIAAHCKEFLAQLEGQSRTATIG